MKRCLGCAFDSQFITSMEWNGYRMKCFQARNDLDGKMGACDSGFGLLRALGARDYLISTIFRGNSSLQTSSVLSMINVEQWMIPILTTLGHLQSTFVCVGESTTSEESRTLHLIRL